MISYRQIFFRVFSEPKVLLIGTLFVILNEILSPSKYLVKVVNNSPLLILLFEIISYLIVILLLGYLFEVIRAGLQGKQTLPKWENWRNLLRKGFGCSLIYFIYSPGLWIKLFLYPQTFELVSKYVSTFTAWNLLDIAYLLQFPSLYLSIIALIRYAETSSWKGPLHILQVTKKSINFSYFYNFLSILIVGIFISYLISFPVEYVSKNYLNQYVEDGLNTLFGVNTLWELEEFAFWVTQLTREIFTMILISPFDFTLKVYALILFVEIYKDRINLRYSSR